MSSPKSIAVIVTFQPDLGALRRLLDRLLRQVATAIIVDNGSDCDLGEFVQTRPYGSVSLISLSENLGIAVAQNRGLMAAKQRKADYIVLFDQDSMPAPQMVKSLVRLAEGKRQSGEVVAAIGPNFVDERLQKSAIFLRTSGWRSIQQTDPTQALVPVDHLIASGSLIPVAAFDQVGPMREDLFIDYVDTEWGLRAEHQHGLLSYGTYDAELEHELGDQPIRFLGKNYVIHSPVRHYYLFRNSIWLWRQQWVPLRWKFARAPKLILRLGFCVIFGRPLKQHWRCIGAGVWHGLSGKMGRLDAN